jgi:lysine 6-dehydrogenase
MRFIVLGAGLQGTACAYDLLEFSRGDVALADKRIEQVPDFLRRHLGHRLSTLELDAGDEGAMRATLAGYDVALCALPYYLNLPMTRLAVASGTHFADLGGNTEIVRQQEALDEAARSSGVSVVPDCGLAPGLVNILAAEGIRRLERTRRVKLYVGGLPVHPKPPLNYQVVYSLEGALDYYTTPSWVLRDGQPQQVDALSEIEEVEFPEPLGALEAFHTAGGISTMPWTYAGCVGTMEYKTLRYPGHAAIMRAIRDLGLLSLEPVNVKGTPVRPRDLFIAVLDPQLRRPESDDLVALRVVVEGVRQGHEERVSFRLLDRADRDHGISAMMRTTGYSLSVTGQMQAEGAVEPGVRPAYEAVPFGPYVEGLRRRGIEIVEE